jgi:hypothetical protein
MFSEFFFFWIFLILLCEILVSRSNTSYTLSLFFYIIITGVIYLFWKEFDLFASILLAVYSSVFLVLLLFYIYFNRYITKIIFETVVDSQFFVDFIVLISSIFVFYIHFFFDGFFFINQSLFSANASWLYILLFVDSYTNFFEKSVYTVNLMHVILYKLFAVEIFFLNVYLLLGLFSSAVFLLFLKITYNPSFLNKFLAISRYSFNFFFSKNSRIRTVNSLRRQIRLKNTSHIKYKI